MLVSIEGSPIINQKMVEFWTSWRYQTTSGQQPRPVGLTIPWGQKKPAAEIYGWLNQE